MAALLRLPIPWLLVAFACVACPNPETPMDDSGEGHADGDADSDADSDDDFDLEWACPSDAEWNCPDATAYVGDASWVGVMHATAEACYCSAFNEERTTLAEELSTKARFRVLEGSWPLPTESGTHDLVLPTCSLWRNGPGPALSGVGQVTVEADGDWGFYLEHKQPLAEGWTFDARIILDQDGLAPLLLDGRQPDSGTESLASLSLNPPGVKSWEPLASFFAPCAPTNAERNTHVVTFEGGEVTLVLLIGFVLGGTEPAAFTHAEGNLDGTTFAQDDYFKLVYNPTSHHFTRDFAVVFDTPIGKACALRIENIDPWQEDPPTTVWTAECDLTPVEERLVTGETFTIDG